MQTGFAMLEVRVGGHDLGLRDLARFLKEVMKLLQLPVEQAAPHVLHKVERPRTVTWFGVAPHRTWSCSVGPLLVPPARG